MSEIQLNKESYRKLINQDIDWLKQNTQSCLERDHIIDVLKKSVNMYYGEPEKKDTTINKANLRKLSWKAD